MVSSSGPPVASAEPLAQWAMTLWPMNLAFLSCPTRFTATMKMRFSTARVGITCSGMNSLC